MQAEWFSHYYRIDLRETPNRYLGESLVGVGPASPMLLRREVEKFAYYFRREFRYDCVQYQANELGQYTAHFIPSNQGNVWVGACCFCKCVFPQLGGIKLNSMQWISIHPYFRRKSILKMRWDMLRDKYGDFFLEHPLSPAMRSFFSEVRQRFCDSAWYQAIESGEPNWEHIKVRLQTVS